MHLLLPNTIYSVLHNSARDRLMLVDGEQHVTYGQAIDRVDSLARWLLGMGVCPGDRVVLQLRKSVNEILLLYAVSRVGAVFVNVHPLWSDDQLRYVIESSGASVAFVEENRLGALTELGNLQVFVGGDSCGALDASGCPLADAGGEGLAAWANDPGALAAIIYTSGSTGRPKGVMHSQRNLVAFGANVATYLGNFAGDRVLSVLALSFGYGLSQMLTVTHVGATLVLQRSALAADVVEALALHAITGFGTVPTMWRQIVEVRKQNAILLPHLRYITNAGDALGERLIEELIEGFPNVDLVLMYGTTETLRSSYLNPAKLAEKRGAIGTAVPGVQLYVLTEDGRIGKPGDHGVLLHGGAHVMLGYWNDPLSTADKLRRYPGLLGEDTVLCCTDDRVRIDADGCLWFEGRAPWMLKVHGFRVSLAEVEEMVNNLGVVKACVATLGVDQGRDEIHVAVIAKTGGPSSPKDVLKILRRNMPSYMVPTRVSFWQADTFPCTPNGKIDRVNINSVTKTNA